MWFPLVRCRRQSAYEPVDLQSFLRDTNSHTTAIDDHSGHFPDTNDDNDDMRLPKPRETEVHGNKRWLVRIPKAMGGGREYFTKKEDADKKVSELRRNLGSVSRDFHKLSRKYQAELLLLLHRFDNDMEKLKSAVAIGEARAVSGRKVLSEAVTAFNTDHKAGASRTRNVRHYLKLLSDEFGDRFVSDLETLELQRWVDGMDWGPKTANECRQVLSQFWKYCITFCRWASENPASKIKRKREPRHLVAIYTPEETEKVLRGLAKRKPVLVPGIAMWAFAGMRQSEIARVPCEQVHESLASGHLELTAEQAGKTGMARIVPILPNLKAWLEKYLPKTGMVIPEKWGRSPERLHEMVKAVARLTKVKTKPNGFRHSFGTYRFKITNDVGQTTDDMGTSIAKFEKHYRNRSKAVTLELATSYFSIVP